VTEAPTAEDAILREVFGHAAFRPGQREAVAASLAGRDAVVVLPTSGGKSLCYQVPAVALWRAGRGPTLVVSPLVALMTDQVAALARRGIPAAALHRATPSAERKQVLSDPRAFALLYASPERLADLRFVRVLARAGVARVAIDEAHCIHEWGHDFRKDYLALGALKSALAAPTLALTATASPRLASAIAESLGLVDPLHVRVPFDRPELALSVEHLRGDDARAERCAALLREAGLGDRGAGRAIVYAATRKRTRAVMQVLKRSGIAGGYYHAGRTAGAREQAQEAFRAGEHAVMVATTAFGMGIDLPDVRLVVHVQAPATLEAYAQQAGRAGRDGRSSRCVLLYGPADALTHARLRGDTPSPGAVEGWDALQDYVYGVTCRRTMLAARFGDVVPQCGVCDACTDPERVQREVARRRAELRDAADARASRRAADDAVELTAEQHDAIVAFVDALRRPAGRTVVAVALRGGRTKRVRRLRLQDNPAFGALGGVPERAIVRAIDHLLEEGRLAAKGRKYPTVWIPEKRVRGAAAPRAPRTPETGLAAALRNFRLREARRRRWKPYQVFPDAVLKAIVVTRPHSVADLLALPGMGPKRIEKFSHGILELVAATPG
jgi:ATP-dependent DNA helicase RecQ